MSEKEKLINEIVEKIKGLPEEKQEAVCWMIKNLKTAKAVVKGEAIPQQELEACITEAVKDEKYTMAGLLLLKQENETKEKH